MKDLPEDSSRWPEDPFELLNLQRSDDARTAKRAYFKLIRKYKPDRSPVEFQKIRAAYESVESWLSWQDQHPDEEETFSSVPHQPNETAASSNSVEMTAADDDESAEPIRQTTYSSTTLKADPVEMFFATLSSKSLNEAIPHLRDVDPSQNSGQVAKASLIKYFVARFLPNSMGNSHAMPANEEVDLGYSKGDLKRIALLLEALDSPDTSSTAMAQLRFEFDQNHRLANCESVSHFLSKATDLESLSPFYFLRWEAIGHYQPWTVVNDVKANQHRSLEFGRGQEGWLSLLRESMNYTVWQRDAGCVNHSEASWKEIAENDQTWTADSVELLVLAADLWKRTNGAPHHWMTVIPWARNTLQETSRRVWTPVTQEISADPVEALQTLDYLYRKYSLLMSVFEEGLESLSRVELESAADELPWEETRKLVAGYFMDIRSSDYARNRIPMMEFCILNQMSPQTFAAAANSFVRHEASESWFDLVQRDGPLKCVVNACHVAND
ncbi:J domain-containing protein [Mariniblastus sp.]|nr:J domain-containing protein [Mariniblastus sp.]